MSTQQRAVATNNSYVPVFRRHKEITMVAAGQGSVRVGVSGQRADSDEAFAGQQNQAGILGIF